MNTLQERVTRLRALPVGWTSSIIVSGHLVIVKLCSGQQFEVPTVLYMVTISEDFTWNVRRGENTVSKESDVIAGSPCSVQSVEGTDILVQLDNCKLCNGNSDEKFIDLIAWREGKFMDLTYCTFL